MKNFCKIVTAFCLPSVRDKIAELKDALEKKGLLPEGLCFENEKTEMDDHTLFFVSFYKKNEEELRNLIRKMHYKKRKMVIVSDNETDYFDFAMEYNICNIININDLNKFTFLGVIIRFLNNDLSLNPFFEKDKTVFDKEYIISGELNMHNIVTSSFPDFLEKTDGIMRSVFTINCHELITNAIAYGIMGVTSYARDKKAYDFEESIDIPEDKSLQVRLIMDANHYGISVRDPGGVLSIQRVLERIRRQSVVAGETIPQGVEDLTGRGLAILSHHGLLMFSIKPGVYTEVSLISHLKPGIERKPISLLATEV